MGTLFKLLGLVGVAFSLAAGGWAAPSDAEIKATYRSLIDRVELNNLRRDVEMVANFGSRLTGSPAEAETLVMVEERLRSLGGEVRREEFTVTVPDPAARGTLRLGGAQFELFPMWPNLVRTATCNVSGPLIYGRNGSLEALSGKPVRGAIVVLDFNSGSRWRNPARLGAAAIVFVAPDEPSRAEAEQKLTGVPLSIPRFYLPLRQAGPVLAAAVRGETGQLSCRQDWVARPSAIVSAEFPGTDAALSKQPVALLAYADAMSIVPGLAPGAEVSGGLAAMLEAARIWKERPGKRPLRLVAYGGHGLGLQGAREWVERLITEPARTPFLSISLDFTSGSSSIGSYGRGWFYEFRDESQEPIRGISRTFRAHTDRLASVMGLSPARTVLVDAVNNGDSRTWKNNISGKFAFDCEPMVNAGINALTFATTEDSRPRVDTPFDTVDHVDFSNLWRQTQTLVAMLHHALNDPANKGEISDHKVPLDMAYPNRMRLVGGFSTVEGRVVTFDPTRSFVPDTPLTGTLAVLRGRQDTMMGVRGNWIQATEPETARYRFLGAPPMSSYWSQNTGYTRISAFRLDPGSGNIDHAASLGVYGDFRFPTVFELKVGVRTSPIVVFRCVSVDVYDMVDPQDLNAIREIRILDSRTGSNPMDYGMFSPPFDMRLNPFIEDTQVLFFVPGQPFILLGGNFENRMVLNNAEMGDEKGLGYIAPGAKTPPEGRAAIAYSGILQDTSLNVARDLWTINQTRLDRFEKYRIISPSIRDLQANAAEEIKNAEAAQEAMRWSPAAQHARAAWGFALRAHPVIMSTANDVVNGVVFYLFLLIPFSYFVERLVFGFQLLTKQLAASCAIFVASFVLLRLIHPAFEIVQNPSMIFIAFIMGVLSLIVISFILGKFENSLKAIRQAQTGMHEVDMRRSSVAMAAFNLGVSNMRRRKARTFLTTLTLVVMTFIVLSFTSIVSDLALNESPSPNKAEYSGMLVRFPGLDPLQLNTYRTIANEFQGKATVVRRAFYYGADIGDNSVLALQRADRVADCRAMVGMDPEETLVTQPQRALLPGGRWFRAGDRNVVILPKPIADQLKVDPGDVGRATVRYAGVPYTVIGIIDPGTLRAIADLDGDGILPPDFSLSRQFQEQTRSQTQAFRSYIRLDPGSVFLVPADTALELGADMRTVAVRFADPAETRKALDDLMPRLRLNLYASVPSGDGLEVRQFSVFQASKSTGLALILVQLAIAAVFVLNTMIASVYERTKEIGIFSAIGLAPNHIGMLFFAESLVYGVLGAVVGYFLAQGAAKIVVLTGAFPGLTLNFSSTGAVLSAVLVMLVVIGSTIYPARKAAQIAAPAMNDEVFKTEPTGDEWRLPLPFSISDTEAGPLMAFLGEWLQAYEGYTIGEFVTKDARYGRLADDGHGERYVVESITWLAPYDLGVSQHLRLLALPGRVKGVYVLDLELRRTSGDPENWPIVNRRFLAAVRRQFLTWRTLDKEQRGRYEAMVRGGLPVLELEEDPTKDLALAA